MAMSLRSILIPGSEGVRSPKKGIQDSSLEQKVRCSDQALAPEHTPAEALRLVASSSNHLEC